VEAGRQRLHHGQSYGRVPPGTTRSFAKPILGDTDKVLLLGETGAREVALPTRKPAPAQ
jgi:hypothetical protein